MLLRFKGTSTNEVNNMPSKRITIKVGGMTCSHCVNRVKNAVEAVEGVEEVRVDLKGGLVVVSCSTEFPTIDRLRETITDTGYEFLGESE